MTLQRLLAASFNNGCGVSMERALLAPRYQELVSEHAGDKNGATEEFAQVELLGEMLADRAAKNLPIRVRNIMHRWGEGPDAQRQVLDVIMRTMSSAQWKKYGDRRNTRRRYGTQKSVLPAIVKSWERGPVRPNCLGIAQMLVGFARSVGARHYLVTTLKTEPMQADEMMLQVLDAIDERLSKLKNVPEVQRLRADMQKERVATLCHIDKLQREQAHHALLIQLSDGSWYVVDPYFSILQKLEINRWRRQFNYLLARIDKTYAGMLLSPPLTEKGKQYRKRIETFAVALVFLRNHIARLNRRKRFDSYAIEQMAVTIALYCLGLTEEESQKFDLKTATKQQLAVFSNVHYVLMDFAYVPSKVRKAERDGKVVSTEQFKEYIRITRRNRVRYKRAQWRLLRGVAQLMLDVVHKNSEDRDSRMHQLLDVGHPAITVACATLNHQRAKSGVHIHGRLALYTSSQWILHDTLAAAECGDTPDANSQRVIKKHTKRLAKNGPEMTLDAIKPYLAKGW